MAETGEKDGQRYVYVAKGNKTTDFYRYDAVEDSFSDLEPIPGDEGGKTKLPRKGCAAATDGVSAIYMTKGNNTTGFWKYDIGTNTWTRLADVPLGADGKKVKGGNDLAYVPGTGDTGWVYLLKGYKTSFYRFNTVTAAWDSTLTDVPYGGAPKYDKGSFLVYDEAGHLYAHQAKYNDGTSHYMFKYDLAAGMWGTAMKGMPMIGAYGGKEKSKKSKDGGSGAWDNGAMYALKGGNTCMFYKYEPGAKGDSWTELDTVPSYGSTLKKKKLKAGADLAVYAPGVFFALKGNKTYEFWRYVQPTANSLQPTARSGVMAERMANGGWQMAIAPNPLASGFATVSYSLPRAGAATVTVLDVAGRTVSVQTLVAQRAGAVPLDLRKLANGVYLVRFDAEGYTQNRKLVVQK
jgi:hypothetical protein